MMTDHEKVRYQIYEQLQKLGEEGLLESLSINIGRSSPFNHFRMPYDRITMEIKFDLDVLTDWLLRNYHVTPKEQIKLPPIQGRLGNSGSDRDEDAGR